MNNQERREAIYLIEWKNNLKSYFYGTALHYKGRGWVSFENELMPPGCVILRWKSDRNYQADRHEPELVPLSEGEAYCLRAHWHCEPENGLFLKAVFYDIRGRMICDATEFGSDFHFVCPEGCCSWELQLVNGGVRKFELYYLAFAKAEVLERPWLSGREIKTDPVFIFGEPQGSTIVCPDRDVLERIGSAVFVPVQYAENIPMREQVILPRVTENTVLISYGPRGNRAVADLTRKAGCSGFICWDRDEDPPVLEGSSLSFYISRSLPKGKKRVRLPLITGMADYSHRLQDFPFDVLS